MGEGKEKRVRDSWSLGCYGGEAVERETFSEAKLGVLLIFAREKSSTGMISIGLFLYSGHWIYAFWI